MANQTKRSTVIKAQALEAAIAIKQAMVINRYHRLIGANQRAVFPTRIYASFTIRCLGLHLSGPRVTLTRQRLASRATSSPTDPTPAIERVSQAAKSCAAMGTDPDYRKRNWYRCS